MLSVKELKAILEKVPEDAHISLNYDSFCGGSDFENQYGIILYSVEDNDLMFCCEDVTEALELLENKDIVVIYSGDTN